MMIRLDLLRDQKQPRNSVRDKDGLREVKGLAIIRMALKKISLTQVRATIQYLSVISLHMMTIQFTLLFAVRILTQILCKISMILSKIQSVERLSQGRHYAGHYQEMIVIY